MRRAVQQATSVLHRWWWLIVVLLFVTCVALKLNGSSMGRWQRVLREPEPIRGLLAGTPKNIRSDEWVVWTPSILSQARQLRRSRSRIRASGRDARRSL